MAGKECVLAVDLGTSGCKVAAIGFGGEVFGWQFEPVETYLLPGGGAEQDAGEWWRAFLAAAQRLLNNGTVSPSQVRVLCCSTQGECTVPVDTQGKPLMNAILWMDARGAEYLPSITDGLINVAGYSLPRLIQWIRLTGGAPSKTGKDPVGHMLYIKHARPDIYEKTHVFLNALDYMLLCLTGRAVATYDSILTSWVTDNRNVARVSYHDALIRMSGIDRGKLPEIVPCTETVGDILPEVASSLGLDRAIKVVAGAIDTSAAALGAGAVQDYEPHLYIGTSSWLAAHVPFKRTDVLASMVSVPCAVTDRYLLIGLQATAGGNLEFLRDTFMRSRQVWPEECPSEDFFTMADRLAQGSPPGSNNVLYTPWVYGERCPVEDRAIRASFANLSLGNSAGDIVRAVLEGVAFNTRWLLDPFEKNLGRHACAIRIAGGGARSDVWCQIFADVLDRPILQLADPIQANVLGAAYIALVGMKVIQFGDIPSLARYRREYQPDPDNRARYDSLFREFRGLYRRDRAMCRRLNRIGSKR